MYQNYYQNPNMGQQGQGPQRMTSMQQMAPMSMQNNPYTLKGRPVSSLEEVRATGIDFDGSVFYFPDLANQRIYTKQINMDGTATLRMYEQKELPSDRVGDYITRTEFEEAMNKLQTSFAAPAQTPTTLEAAPVNTTAATYNF